ncbi:hypothetical protein ACKI1I_18820 [Streptomyces turgidiscabies]|uniref:Putative lipoprotein n=1 Tax=Streptomyces turgidiscabies (strain Car8) TaxID=698760 RepID=L7EWL2_STRT8|nr:MULTISPECIES: hypothetical protein [Streptomyces]ELP63427.1 putative lipoprotein [Streptomyces turgidiscabies Car8]MDX3497832.1 hypothetical protein [Streptomyces turgidiscabies]GAQ69736.1 hypothetical protein T45_01467 [Streptomyces turgidiscabies]
MADVSRRTRGQLRSGTVVLGGMGLLAAALTACSSDDPDKRCVDRDSYRAAKGYKVVAEKNCKTTTAVNGAHYYGGKKKSGWVKGGSFTKSGKGSGGSGSSDDDRSGTGVHRGGFGGGGDSSGG